MLDIPTFNFEFFFINASVILQGKLSCDDLTSDAKFALGQFTSGPIFKLDFCQNLQHN